MQTMLGSVVLMGFVLAAAADSISDANKMISNTMSDLSKKVNETVEAHLHGNVPAGTAGGSMSVSGACNTTDGTTVCVKNTVIHNDTMASTVSSVQIVQPAAPAKAPVVVAVTTRPAGNSAPTLALSSTFLTLFVAALTKFI